MSADARHQHGGLRLVLLCGCLACTWPATAADDDQPDMAFLEYLGSWEGSDEDWLLVDGVLEMAKEDKRSDPAPDGEESTEQQNES